MEDKYKDKTLEQLKAIVYDLLVLQQKTNVELQIVNSLIAKKE